MEQVILVNERDEELGSEEKLRAHQNGGLLHRAFSVFIFNGLDELLLQRRAPAKYHFGGLWSNTCCGHPRPGEATADAAVRRLGEEFGFQAKLREIASFSYDAHDQASDLTEREFLHVLVGRYDGEPSPNRAEIGDWRWLSLEFVERDLRQNTDRYTPWFARALAAVERYR